MTCQVLALGTHPDSWGCDRTPPASTLVLLKSELRWRTQENQWEAVVCGAGAEIAREILSQKQS